MSDEKKHRLSLLLAVIGGVIVIVLGVIITVSLIDRAFTAAVDVPAARAGMLDG